MFKVRQFLPLCSNCFKRSRYRKNIVTPILYFSYRQTKSFSSQNETTDLEDRPIKYSTSPAIKYKARTTITGVAEERLWYEPYVLMVSIVVFLLYFCIFREENDVDKELDKSLYSRIEGLEELQLRLSLRYNEDNGLDTKDIRHRLDEIEQEKQKSQTVSTD